MADVTETFVGCSTQKRSFSFRALGNRTRYTTLPIGNVDDLTPRVGLDHLKLPPDDPEDAKPSNDPPRIACWIMTSPGNHETKAFAVSQAIIRGGAKR